MTHLLSWLILSNSHELNQAFVSYKHSEANEDLLRLADAARSAGVAAGRLSPSIARYQQIVHLDPRGFDPEPAEEDWITRIDEFTKWAGQIEEVRDGVRDRELFENI